MLIISIIGFIAIATIHVYLFYRCYKKRQINKNIK